MLKGDTRETGKGARKEMLLAIIFLFMPLLAWGQDQPKMSVAEFYQDQQDITANTEGTIVLDQNGEKSALIKIKTTQKGFSFDNGNLGIVKVDESPVAEVWVYVPKGTRHLEIKHQILGSIDYEFNTPILSAKTYIMKLTTNEVMTMNFDRKHQGQLILKINPPISNLVLDGSRIVDVTNGEYKAKEFFGTHTFEVSADRYHPFKDTVTINDSKNPKTRNVQLKQAWGWLQFANAGKLSNAKLFIDGEARGNISGERLDVNSGQHVLKIIKPLYETYEEEFTINDSATLSLSPQMEENYGLVDITVADSKAEIYVDGEYRGTGSIRGDSLGSGSHTIEARRASHMPVTKTINVITNSHESYELSAPVPVYGTLSIKTREDKTNKAVNVKVRIDDEKESKETDSYSNDKVLIGRHTVTVSQDRYRKQVFDVDIAEGMTTDTTIAMIPEVRVKFTSSPSAVLTIDGRRIGYTPQDTVLRSDVRHSVELYTYGYSRYKSDNEKFTVDNDVFSKSLLRIYYGKNEAYIEGGGNAGMMMGYYGAVGMYIHNVNFEGIYSGPLGASETVYQTYTNDTYYSSYISSYEYEVKPKHYIGGRIGYGIKLGGRWRITPQVGGGVTSIDIGDDGSTYVATGTAGLKLQVCLTKCVSVVLKPEYNIKVSEGSDFKKLSEVSSKIKGWGEGFNIYLGFNFYY